VSPKNVEKAKAFLANAEPALVKLVEEPGSKLSLDAACEVAKLKSQLGWQLRWANGQVCC
jgi:hypothetical protein